MIKLKDIIYAIKINQGVSLFINNGTCVGLFDGMELKKAYQYHDYYVKMIIPVMTSSEEEYLRIYLTDKKQLTKVRKNDV